VQAIRGERRKNTRCPSGEGKKRKGRSQKGLINQKAGEISRSRETTYSKERARREAGWRLKDSKKSAASQKSMSIGGGAEKPDRKGHFR